MSLNVIVSYQAGQSVNDVLRKFKNQLSEKEIKRTVDWALNDTTRRVQGFIRKEVRQDYTVNNKYLSKATRIKRYSNYKKGSQHTELDFEYTTIPMSAFKYNGRLRSKKPVIVEIKKGRPIEFRHAFVRKNATGKTNNKGIYEAGEYVSGKFVHQYKTADGKKIKTTQLRGPSAFTMFTSRNMQGRIIGYVEKRLPSQLKYLLQRKVDKMRNV